MLAAQLAKNPKYNHVINIWPSGWEFSAAKRDSHHLRISRKKNLTKIGMFGKKIFTLKKNYADTSWWGATTTIVPPEFLNKLRFAGSFFKYRIPEGKGNHRAIK